MLRTVGELRRTPLHAQDGEIGRSKDFLFDDRHWTIRYMVADTGTWIPGRKVLISPIALGDPESGALSLSVELTREQIEKAPALAEDAPVSRQHEMALHQHYGYGYYWSGADAWGAMPTPQLLRREGIGPGAVPVPADGDPNLRSVNEVTGYAIGASDGNVGHVEDFLVDDRTWTLRYLVVDTRNWLPGRKVVLALTWVSGFDWVDRTASVDLTRTQIEGSPEYRETVPVDRDYETRLHDFYERPAYWDARGV